ncbi:hypothetical protein [Terricaulis silvestris]|uniref:hypothetical protein n=1 Tax=Terricaulis silvestris TaxID=2686094 RepID=UPI00131B2528|nr:hypothetical protein [Terricaulis silvestris]
MRYGAALFSNAGTQVRPSAGRTLIEFAYVNYQRLDAPLRDVLQLFNVATESKLPHDFWAHRAARASPLALRGETALASCGLKRKLYIVNISHDDVTIRKRRRNYAALIPYCRERVSPRVS